jgi:hypothetical protein
MKKSIFTLSLVASALIISTSYCQNPDNKTENAKENLQEERLDVVVAKQDLTDAQNADYTTFKQNSEDKIKKNAESINDLKIKVLKTDEKFRTENQMRLGVLEQKNIVLQNQMNDYKNESQEKWAAFKQKFNYDMDELIKALKEFTILT